MIHQMRLNVFLSVIVVCSLSCSVAFSSDSDEGKNPWDRKQVSFSDELSEGIAHPKIPSDNEVEAEGEYEEGLEPYDRSSYPKRDLPDEPEPGEEEDEALTQRLKDAAENTSLNETVGEREEGFHADSKAEKAKKNEEAAREHAAQQRELDRQMAQEMQNNPDPERDEIEWE